MTNLTGKTVLVTGGSRGIGAAISKAVGTMGGQVLRHYARNRSAAETVQREIGAERCHIIQADLAHPGEVDQLWAGAVRLSDRVDVLVNNAGIFEDVQVDAPLEDWRDAWARVLQVNLQAPADLCRAAILHFRERGGGKIINVNGVLSDLDSLEANSLINGAMA